MQNILTGLLQASAAGAVELSKTGEHIQKVARSWSENFYSHGYSQEGHPLGSVRHDNSGIPGSDPNEDRDRGTTEVLMGIWQYVNSRGGAWSSAFQTAISGSQANIQQITNAIGVSVAPIQNVINSMASMASMVGSWASK